MTWQVGAFVLLGLGLAAGFGWYERTRPDAKTVALVGTLAALAALGRIAFAPLPNVKPTTDIVLIAGYTLGGAPGYVVGALAGLTSNFFFGQGPWTPWQMAGWGLTGMLGAMLAAASGRQIGRRTLTAVCFVVGFAFTALQDLGDWVTYSDHSVTQLGVYVGKGLGFDLIHAVGCAGFALAFGPTLLRMLTRFRRRMTVTWSVEQAGLGVSVALIAVLGGSLLISHSAQAGVRGNQPPIRYLLSSQNPDGGFGNSPGESSNPMVTGWSILALAAGGEPAADAVHAPGDASAAQYLAQTVHQDLGDPGSIERTMLAAKAAGLRPNDLGGVDLTARLNAVIRPNGSVAGQTNLTAFAVLALSAANTRVPGAMVDWLVAQQDQDGGFNFSTAGPTSDVDDTAAVLEALSDANRTGAVKHGTQRISPQTLHRVISRAVRFIRSQQRHDGGFPSQDGGLSNAQSTAFAVQGLIAAGVRLASVHTSGGATADSYLRSLIGSTGAVGYSKGSNQTPVWVTAEAELALSGHALPVAAPAGAAAPVAPAPSTPTVKSKAEQSSSGSAAKPQAAAVNSAHAKQHPAHHTPRGKATIIRAGRVMGWIGAIEGVALGMVRS